MARRAGDELVEIDRPHLSIFLTGTPGQLFPLLHSVENGLFSRFTFYCLDASIEWRSQFNGVDNHLEKFFDRQAKKVLEMWIAQEGEGKSYVAFTKAQQERADEYFSKALGELSDLLGNEVGASVKRMCLIWQRIAMVLTATRSFEASAKMPSMLIVDDQDVEVAFSLTSLLLKHLKEVFASMSRHNVRSKLNENQRRLWELLPDRFARQEYDVTLKQIQIPKKTGEKYIKDFIAKGLLRRIKQGEYSKIR
jgi:hypothetical protein